MKFSQLNDGGEGTEKTSLGYAQQVSLPLILFSFTLVLFASLPKNRSVNCSVALLFVCLFISFSQIVNITTAASAHSRQNKFMFFSKAVVGGAVKLEYKLVKYQYQSVEK